MTSSSRRPCPLRSALRYGGQLAALCVLQSIANAAATLSGQGTFDFAPDAAWAAQNGEMTYADWAAASSPGSRKLKSYTDWQGPVRDDLGLHH
jgi:hypothetical protein